MYNETKNNLLTNNSNNITKYDHFKNPLKKVDIQIQADLFPEIMQKFERLPFLGLSPTYSNFQKKLNLRKRLANLENFCQNIYTNCTNTMNNTKTVGDILNDTKKQAIDNITSDYFEGKITEDSYNKNFEKKKSLNNYKPSSIRKINLKKKYDEDFIFITTNYEIKKRENKNNNFRSIDNYNFNRNKWNRFNFGDFANKKLVINHPTLYVLTNKSQNSIGKLPNISPNTKRLNVIEEMTKVIPDKIELSKEERIMQYEKFLRARKLKKV